MKIVEYCNYVPPAKDSMGAERVVEYISKGLVELGHTVYMKLHDDAKESPVDGAILVKEIPDDADIVHFHGWPVEKTDKPWVTTIHGGGNDNHAQSEGWYANPHIICVSKFISDRTGCPAYVHTCVDPDKFIYSKEKDDYFLWMAGTDWGEAKGLFSTIEIAKRMRLKLIIAGSGKNQRIINEIKSFCDDKISYVGSVNGEEKAKLLSKAKAFFLLSNLPDACPATVSESLISGTPLITSANGALPELINEKIGVVCDSNQVALAKSINQVKKIDPQDCRDYAMQNFSYKIAANKFLQYYNNMLNSNKVV